MKRWGLLSTAANRCLSLFRMTNGRSITCVRFVASCAKANSTKTAAGNAMPAYRRSCVRSVSDVNTTNVETVVPVSVDSARRRQRKKPMNWGRVAARPPGAAALARGGSSGLPDYHRAGPAGLVRSGSPTSAVSGSANKGTRGRLRATRRFAGHRWQPPLSARRSPPAPSPPRCWARCSEARRWACRPGRTG